MLDNWVILDFLTYFGLMHPQGVLLISASGRLPRQIMPHLELPPQLHLFSSGFSQKSNWLMIYDNADGGYQVVEKFIPPGNGGNILMTSKNFELMRITKDSVEVCEMGEEEALSLLSNSARLHDTSELAKQLVSYLGGIPLAIDQAGAYIMTCKCPLDDYLKLYTRNQDKLM